MKYHLIKRMFTILLPALLVFMLIPLSVFAADADNKVEVRLKAGSKTVKINGKASMVEAPFVAKGTTMVPLKVITNAFGAGLKLENGNIITLTYNNRKVVLTFGNKTVKVNGAAKTVAVAPVVVKGSTMVPLRIIVEAFGAKITADSVTKETVIIGDRAQSSGTGGTSIDTDYGKTKVGDSYQKWTLNYPAGLVQVEQSDNGDYVRWADTADTAKVAAQVNVITEPVGEDKLTIEEQRDILYGYYYQDEITVDKRTITVSGLTFEKLVTYTKQSKMYYEYRGIQLDDTYYIVIVGANGTDKSVLNSYETLLNSFTPSFNQSDKTIKDITKVKDGYVTFKDADYGLTVKLPTDWSSDPESTTPWYANETDAFGFSFSSLTEGDTLENAAARREARIREDVIGANIRNFATAPVQLQDGNALMLSYELSYGEDDWFTIHEIYFISGNYRYLLDYIYPSSNSAKSNPVFKQVVASVDIDTAFIEKSFGLIEDDEEWADRSKKVTKRSAEFGYSIDIPAYWYGVRNNFNEDDVYYTFKAGEMNIFESEKSAASIVPALSGVVNIPENVSQGMTVKESSTVTINGKTAYKVVLHASKPKEGLPSSQIFYVFDTAEGSLTFTFVIYDIYATDSNLKLINDAAQSIRFN